MAAVRHLVFADGTVFTGDAFGAKKTVTGEGVFTTGMTGYQEILTDPSYAGQVVTMTAPEIGNTGINDDDVESSRPWVTAFVVHRNADCVSNWRASSTLGAYLEKWGIPGISGIDTRAITQRLRTHGAQNVAIGDGSIEDLLAAAKSAPSMAGQDLTKHVSVTKAVDFSEPLSAFGPPLPSNYVKPKTPLHVVAMDFGVKRNMLRHLVSLGLRVTLVPGAASVGDIMGLKPDGVFLSNGPGDPAAVPGVREKIRALTEQTSVFGICLGHQMLARALGGETYKMKFGHRGLNHPVKDVRTGRVEITSQNHGFAVKADSLPPGVAVTHVHLNDGTCMGVEHAESGAFSVQYHPEASAGPHDSHYLFERFIDRMQKRRS